MANQKHTSEKLTSDSNWNADEYEAGYQARFEDVDGCVTATACWQAGWQDADREISARVSMGLEEPRRGAEQDNGLSKFGSGELARACDLPFDAFGSEPWKRSWIRADIARGVQRGLRGE